MKKFFFIILLFHSFALSLHNMNNTENIKMSENVIIADADYVDSVAFNLIVNFERMIGRKIPKADLSQWAVCIALDGGLKPGDNETQVVLIHDENKKAMDNFSPSDFKSGINAKAFRDDSLGEFITNSPESGKMVSKDFLMLDVVKTMLNHKEVKRMMIVPDAEHGDIYDKLAKTLKDADDDKRITMFAMQPLPGGNFRQEILGYSLMRALGINADEIK
jgi:hypothetical protein